MDGWHALSGPPLARRPAPGAQSLDQVRVRPQTEILLPATERPRGAPATEGAMDPCFLNFESTLEAPTCITWNNGLPNGANSQWPNRVCRPRRLTNWKTICGKRRKHLSGRA